MNNNRVQKCICIKRWCWYISIGLFFILLLLFLCLKAQAQDPDTVKGNLTVGSYNADTLWGVEFTKIEYPNPKDEKKLDSVIVHIIHDSTRAMIGTYKIFPDSSFVLLRYSTAIGDTVEIITKEKLKK